MNKSQILSELKRVAAELHRSPTREEFRKMGKCSEHAVRRTFGTWAEGLRAAGLTANLASRPEEAGLKAAKLLEEARALRSRVAELEGEAVDAKALRDLIGSIDTSEISKDMSWLRGPTGKRKSSSVTGMPVLVLSDIHFDEVVKASEIGGVNRYNREVATLRLQHTFRTAITLLRKHMVNPRYDGFVLCLGGDLLSGTIHDELAESNEESINKSILAIVEVLSAGITALAQEFGRVFIPCVVGNHGRQHKKPRAKAKAIENYEWLIYQFLARELLSDKRVAFYIPESADAYFQVYGLRVCLTHGDQFRGGDGVGGIMVPILRGLMKKQTRQQAVGQGFDLAIMGHWHQYIHSDQVVINGSVKGYDEYASISNFPFQRPQQALFVIHPDHGVTFRMPVLCDGYEERERSKGPKLSW
jgi:predicted phosphodiesterase